MATLAVMKARIATELDRSDLTAQIADAISDAIAEYEGERFWFNESRDKTFQTVASQRIYTSSDASWIADIVEIDALYATVGGVNRIMDRAMAEESELLADNVAAEGAPFEWTYYNKNIYLYPIPDQAYTIRALGHVRLATLASDSESNAWTTEAERLIRRRAKGLIQAEIMKDAEGAMASDMLSKEEFERLKRESSRRRSTGVIMPTQF